MKEVVSSVVVVRGGAAAVRVAAAREAVGAVAVAMEAAAMEEAAPVVAPRAAAARAAAVMAGVPVAEVLGVGAWAEGVATAWAMPEVWEAALKVGAMAVVATGRAV